MSQDLLRAVFLSLLVGLCLKPAAAQELAGEEVMGEALRQPDKLKDWTLEVHGQAAAQVQSEPGGEFRIQITEPGSEAWHVLFHQNGLDLLEGRNYTIRFRAKSDAPRTYSVQLGTGVPDWHEVSPPFAFQTGTEFQDYEFKTKVTQVVPHSTRGPLFMLGTLPGRLYLDKLSLIGPIMKPQPTPIPSDFFPYPLPNQDNLMGTATDVSFLNEKPAGKNGRIIVRDGRFVEETTGRRVRFLGINIGAAQAFPDRTDAQWFAQRLAKAGINIVRLHSLDNPWAINSGGSIWKRGNPQLEIDPQQLDKVDYLVHQLQQQGIYINMNLKCTKKLSARDGFPDSIEKIPFGFQKRVDYFNRRMIDLQKDYARQLLSHRNPYTGKTYAEDPGVAVVEINNENSLINYWDHPLGKRLDELPEPFVSELRGLWNAWLAKKYADTAAVNAAWTRGITPVGPSILGPETGWSANGQETAKLSLTTSRGADAAGQADDVELDVQAVDGTSWHAQAQVRRLTLKPDDTYTLSFRAKASAARDIAISLQKDMPDWDNLGLSASAKLTTEWKTFHFPFTAKNPPAKLAALTFTVGQSTSRIWLADVTLQPGNTQAGVPGTQSLEQRNIAIPVQPSQQQYLDWVAFLVEVEKSFAGEMHALLKNELGVRANLALSQIEYGGIAGMARERDMDFADAHAYWGHPTFPKSDWNPTEWLIPNESQNLRAHARDYGELSRLAMQRVAGKPYTVSEYDHPAPSDFVAEMMPTFSAFAAVQDWDMIYTFAVDDYFSQSQPDSIRNYFDQTNHPGKWCFYPLAALMFRQGLVPTALGSAQLELPEPFWKNYSSAESAWKGTLPEGEFGFFTHRLSVADTPLAADAQAGLRRRHPPGDAMQYVRLEKTPAGQAMVVSAPAVAAFVGAIGNSTLQATQSQAQVTVESFGNQFAVVSAVATDSQPLGQSRRVLVNVCGRVENQGMGWNEKRTSVGNKWGHGPTIAQFIPARLTLPCDGPRKAYALDATGKRMKEVPVQVEAGKLSLQMRLEHATLMYEITPLD